MLSALNVPQILANTMTIDYARSAICLILFKESDILAGLNLPCG